MESEKRKCTVPGDSPKYCNTKSLTPIRTAKPEDFRELAHLLNLVQEKIFQVIIDRRFRLAEAGAAQRRLEGRGHFGKVVLKMS